MSEIKVREISKSEITKSEVSSSESEITMRGVKNE